MTWRDLVGRGLLTIAVFAGASSHAAGSVGATSSVSSPPSLSRSKSQGSGTPSESLSGSGVMGFGSM